MKTTHLILILASFFILSAYIYSQSSNNDEISVLELVELIESDNKPVILDVRNPDELVGELGHITGVINIPVHEVESRLSELNKYKSKKILVICRSGNRSRYATAIMNKNGFTAINVKGGMRAYNKVKK